MNSKNPNDVFDLDERFSRFGARVYIDGPNFRNSLKNMQEKIDWLKLLHIYRSLFPHIFVKYFISVPSREIDDPLFRQIDWMRRSGYSVYEKTQKKISKGDRSIIKGNMIGELSLQAGMDLVHDKYQNIQVGYYIIMSGDTGLVPILREARRMGHKTIVISGGPDRGFHCTASTEMMTSCDHFIDAADLIELTRKDT